MADIVQPSSTGTPSNSFTLSLKLRSTIVMTPPTPSARAASNALQIAG